MAAAAILFLQKWLFWPRFPIQGVIQHQHTKFDDTPAHPQPGNNTYDIQTGCCRHLVFWLDDIFGHVIKYVALFCTYTQNLSQIPLSWAKLWLFFPNPVWRLSPFYNCKDVIYDYPRWAFGNIKCAGVLNFHSNKLLSFEDIKIFNFLRICLRLPNFAPFWGFLGKLTP